MKILFVLLAAAALSGTALSQTQKPPLHGKNWMAVTGKPLAAEAGAMVFHKGGNAVDAACAIQFLPCSGGFCV